LGFSPSGGGFRSTASPTGQTGKNVKALLNLGQSLHKQASARVSTGELNRVVRAALDRNPRDTEAVRARKNLAAEQALLTKKYDQAGSAQDVAYDPDAFLRAARGEGDQADGEKPKDS